MKNIEKTDFQELTFTESLDISGGLNATVYSLAGLCYLLYRAALTSDTPLS
jgi:hypothetical protein